MNGKTFGSQKTKELSELGNGYLHKTQEITPSYKDHRFPPHPLPRSGITQGCPFT